MHPPFHRLAALLVLAACGGETLAPKPGASVILISIDTLRADRLGCYGADRDTSPHLDALARESLLFERAIAPANNTAPSHATMLTGVLPPVHGVVHRAPAPPSAALPLLAERLAAEGYDTWGLADGGFVTEPFGFARGFDRFFSELEPIDRKLRRVTDWTRLPPARPTFLFFHTYQVHAPYVPAPEHDLWSDPAYAGPLRARVERLRALGASGRYAADLEAEMELFWEGRAAFDDRDRRYLRDLYDAEIRQTDAALGELLDHLRVTGWLDAAWLVVTSDHGEAFGEHGTYNHRQLYQEELRVPLLIRPPGGIAGRRPPGTARVVDVTPTVLGALGLPVPDGLQGRNLLDGALPSAYAVRTDAPSAWAVLEGDRKVLTRDGALAEVYDLAADPDEREDLSAAPPDWAGALLDEARRVEAECVRLRTRWGEPGAAADFDDDLLDTLRALGYLGETDEDR